MDLFRILREFRMVKEVLKKNFKLDDHQGCQDGDTESKVIDLDSEPEDNPKKMVENRDSS